MARINKLNIQDENGNERELQGVTEELENEIEMLENNVITIQHENVPVSKISLTFKGAYFPNEVQA